MKFNSLKEKLSLIISVIVFAVFVVMLVYHNAIIKEQNNKLAYRFMENNALKYSSLLQNEFDRIKSKNDVLALIISKKANDKKGIGEIEKLLKPIVNNNSGIYRITFAYFENDIHIPDSNETVGGGMKTQYLNIIKTLKGTKQNTLTPEDNLKLELFKKNLSEYEGSIVFEFQEHTSFSYIPVLTPVFSGKKYLGYIETCISTDWINENIMLNNTGLPDGLKVYISADNKIIATNSKDFILGENIKSICPDCIAKNTKVNFKKNNQDIYIYCHNILQNENYAGNLRMCLVGSQDNLGGVISYNSWKYFVAGLILLFIALLVIYLIIGYITSPFKQLIAFAQKVAQGDFECEQKDMPIKHRDEIGQLQMAFREISISLKETTQISEAIASGDFSRSLKLKSDKDLLAQAINRMSEFLQSKSEQDEESKREEEKQKWINKGLGLISEVLKRNQEDTRNLADKLIKTLVDFLDASLGGIYMKELNEAGEEIYRLTAAYAYSEGKYIDRKFRSGESLVGSCVSEQRVIYMSSIPSGYINVTSGMGESVPKSLILIPLIYNNEVFGVLELASLREFSENEQEFLQKAADNIASTLSLTQISSQTSILLEKTQKQAQELELRDKEMKATLEKISNLQEQTAKKEAAMRAKITALNNSLLIAEYTVDGIFDSANEKFLNTMGYTLKELKGKNVLDMLNEAERKELIQIIETVKQGNFYETIVRRHTKYEKEKWLIATYTPVLNEEGVTESILFFATDITRIIRKEQSLFTQISGLKDEIHDLLKEKYRIESELNEQSNKIDELIANHKLSENNLLQKMNEQKAEADEKIDTYEQMITEIIAEWETHILNAEKIILDKSRKA
ncbi:MAG: GAF domain-containing protein [Bacteroidales bacterium]|nr:GAF domain-containing protein [Bacteroidales bacterium]